VASLCGPSGPSLLGGAVFCAGLKKGREKRQWDARRGYIHVKDISLKLAVV